MGHETRPTAMAVRLRADGRHEARHGQLILLVISYSLASGTVAVAIGAAVSLAAPGVNRLALWSSVTASAAVGAGFLYDSQLIRDCRRFLRRLARPSTF